MTKGTKNAKEIKAALVLKRIFLKQIDTRRIIQGWLVVVFILGVLLLFVYNGIHKPSADQFNLISAANNIPSSKFMDNFYIIAGL